LCSYGSNGKSERPDDGMGSSNIKKEFAAAGFLSISLYSNHLLLLLLPLYAIGQINPDH
jgi:hypothetical protein